MRLSYHIAFATIIFCGCSSGNLSLPEEPVTEGNEYVELNRWIFAQMNRNYLWREDLPDSVECDYFLAPEEFFNSIMSPKDRFSHLTANDNYNPGKKQYTDLGFAYQEMQDKNGGKAFEVLYITSPKLRRLGLKRGDYVRVLNSGNKFCSIEKISVEDGCFISVNQVLSFSINDLLDPQTVLLDSVYYKDNNRIGYLCYLQYGEINDLENALRNFVNKNITDLILDLRYNPGGLVSTCKFLCNCIVPGNGYGNIFQQYTYNDILSHEYYEKTGDDRTYSYFENPAESLGEQLGAVLTPLHLNRLYVITSIHTASASEATIICLRPYMEVKVIGETTVGKGVGSRTIADSRYKYAIKPITMRYYNAEGYSTPDSGIKPDIYVADSYMTGKLEIGDTNERLLKIALGCLWTDVSQSDLTARYLEHETEFPLTPVGEPSYVTEFNNKHYNEIN